MMIRVVTGKNFGDEGKGLVTDYFARLAKEDKKTCIVIRHNGGAQAGHTVDMKDKRFIFHQLSSGSFRGADTLWADTFMPDLYKLHEEVNDFLNLTSKVPKIYAQEKCRCVFIDDILINMALETFRGKKRHGSCGMGINEAVERSYNEDYIITLREVCNLTSEQLAKKLLKIREEYSFKRLRNLGLDIDKTGEFGELLKDKNVILNVADSMKKAQEYIEIAGGEMAASYEEVIFENAQGLLLDENYEKYAPHLTSSSTGAKNPVNFIKKYLDGKYENVEFVYVTRSYVTRHGAGPLPYEELFNQKEFNIYDKTNVFNPWQENLRFAPHPDPKTFVADVINDLSEVSFEHSASLFITHLNETNKNVCSIKGQILVKDWCEDINIKNTFNNVYFSDSPYSEETKNAL